MPKTLTNKGFWAYLQFKKLSFSLISLGKFSIYTILSEQFKLLWT